MGFLLDYGCFHFACYHADKSQQPIIHFVFRREFLWKSQPCCRILTPKQMAQTQTVLFECDNQSNWSYESVLDEVQMNGLSQRLVSATWYSPYNCFFELLLFLRNSLISFIFWTRKHQGIQEWTSQVTQRNPHPTWCTFSEMEFETGCGGTILGRRFGK